jgi:hypothetical protein
MMKGTMTRTKGLSSAAPERKEAERSEPDWSEGAAAPSATGPQPLVRGIDKLRGVPMDRQTPDARSPDGSTMEIQKRRNR